MAKESRRILEEIHERFLMRQIACFITSPTTLIELLNDPQANDKWGFEPVKITQGGINAAIARIKKDRVKELAEARAEFLMDFDDVPLAYKKNRVAELQRMYHEVPDMKRGDGKGGLADMTVSQEQRAILRQISDEMGEDTEKLADAIRSTASDIPPKTVTPAKLTQLAYTMTQIAQIKQVSDGNSQS